MADLGPTDDLPPVLLCEYGSPAEIDWLRYATTRTPMDDDDAEYRRLLAEVWADDEEEFEIAEGDVVEASDDPEAKLAQALALLDQIATARGATELEVARELAAAFVRDTGER